MLDLIRQAYRHSRIFLVSGRLGDWASESLVARWINTPGKAVDPFAGSMIIGSMVQARALILGRLSPTPKERTRSRRHAEIKRDLLKAPIRSASLFILAFCSTHLTLSLFLGVSPIGVLIEVSAITAALGGFLFASHLEANLSDSKVIIFITQTITGYGGDPSKRADIEEDVKSD